MRTIVKSSGIKELHPYFNFVQTRGQHLVAVALALQDVNESRVLVIGLVVILGVGISVLNGTSSILLGLGHHGSVDDDSLHTELDPLLGLDLVQGEQEEHLHEDEGEEGSKDSHDDLETSAVVRSLLGGEEERSDDVTGTRSDV